MPLAIKSLHSELVDVDAKKGVVVHYWNALGNLDSDGDRIRAGAYAETIADRGPAGANRIKFLWQHDPWEPIGVPLELAEDPSGPGPEGGLRATTKVAATSRGRDTIILYESGVLTEHSVGIDIQERGEEDRSDVVRVRLWEGSVVTWGANPLTPLIDVKQFDLFAPEAKTALARMADHAAKLRKAITEPLTDETAHAIETGLVTLEARIQALSKSLEYLQTNPPADAPTSEAGIIDSLVKALRDSFVVPGDTPNSSDEWAARIVQSLEEGYHA